MKKLLIALSVMTLIASFALSGCGDKEDGKVSTTSTTGTTTTTTTTSATSMNEPSSKTGATGEENLEDKITSAITDLSEKMNGN